MNLLIKEKYVNQMELISNMLDQKKKELEKEEELEIDFNSIIQPLDFNSIIQPLDEQQKNPKNPSDKSNSLPSSDLSKLSIKELEEMMNELLNKRLSDILKTSKDLTLEE